MPLYQVCVNQIKRLTNIKLCLPYDDDDVIYEHNFKPSEISLQWIDVENVFKC